MNPPPPERVQKQANFLENFSRTARKNFFCLIFGARSAKIFFGALSCKLGAKMVVWSTSCAFLSTANARERNSPVIIQYISTVVTVNGTDTVATVWKQANCQAVMLILSYISKQNHYNYISDQLQQTAKYLAKIVSYKL